MEQYKKWFIQDEEKLLREFETFIAFETISSDKTKYKEMEKCVAWLCQQIEPLGFSVEKWEAKDAPPVLYASYIKEDSPTLLLYNHYDVQPVDPLDEWESDPFSLTKKGNKLYGRGASDNKGQCFYLLCALRYYYKQHGTFPCSIKWIIEGEEEVASHALQHFLQEKEIESDYVLLLDSGMREKNVPAISLGVRGIVPLDIIVEGTNQDLHSGLHGGVAYNPLHALVTLLSSLRDEKGVVQVPHFYDKVKKVSDEEKKKCALFFDEEKYKEEFGAEPSGGEHQFSPIERLWFRPTIEINGISGGYEGEGCKTVIPHKASAKLSCRLVPDQNPIECAAYVKYYLENQAPKGISVEVSIGVGYGYPLRVDPNSHLIHALEKGCKKVLGKQPELIYDAGSIPIAAELQKKSGGELAFFGLALPGDRIHAPNEHFSMDRIEKGMLLLIELLQHFSFQEKDTY